MNIEMEKKQLKTVMIIWQIYVLIPMLLIQISPERYFVPLTGWAGGVTLAMFSFVISPICKIIVHTIMTHREKMMRRKKEVI